VFLRFHQKRTKHEHNFLLHFALNICHFPMVAATGTLNITGAFSGTGLQVMAGLLRLLPFMTGEFSQGGVHVGAAGPERFISGI
jgi:hypothetical protein